jgi:hypothetical protein
MSIRFFQGRTNSKILLNLKVESGFTVNWATRIYESIVGSFENKFAYEHV